MEISCSGPTKEVKWALCIIHRHYYQWSRSRTTNGDGGRTYPSAEQPIAFQEPSLIFKLNLAGFPLERLDSTESPTSNDNIRLACTHKYLCNWLIYSCNNNYYHWIDNLPLYRVDLKYHLICDCVSEWNAREDSGEMIVMYDPWRIL